MKNYKLILLTLLSADAGLWPVPCCIKVKLFT